MSINTREELEEERRLFYVAITRAKHKLWVSYANTRYRFGSLIHNEPSRFIDELPEQFLDRSYAGGGRRNQGTEWGSSSAFNRLHGGFDSAEEAEKKYGAPPKKGQPASYITTSYKPQTINHTPSADFKASDTSSLQVGQKIEHQKFGFGEVTKMEGSAHSPIATVKFDLNGEKKIMLNYAKLRIVE